MFDVVLGRVDYRLPILTQQNAVLPALMSTFAVWNASI
jgi:hypothetical protein